MNPGDIASRILGPIEWVDESMGYCNCPGASSHSTKTKRRDCRVYIDAPANVHCVHTSCQSMRLDASKELRRALREGDPRRYSAPVDHAAIEARKAKMQEFNHWHSWAETCAPMIFKRYAWSQDEAFESSPIRPDGESADYSLFLSLWEPSDRIWIGEPTDSGSHAADHFRTAADWKLSEPAGHFTCPASWKDGFRRTNESVLYRPFMVVESDTLTHDQTATLAKWMSTFIELRMMLYSGGKSLHCWFDMPSPKLFELLKTILPVLGCDPALFKPSQPVRCPGVKRDNGNWQSLIYFNPKPKF